MMTFVTRVNSPQHRSCLQWQYHLAQANLRKTASSVLNFAIYR